MSHLSCIGFHSESDEELRKIAMRAFEQAEPMKAGDNFYMYYREESGAELWLQFDKQKQLIGLSPHFDSAGYWLVGLKAMVEQDQNSMDGSFFGEVLAGQSGDRASGLFPILFDTPDFARVQPLTFPTEQEVWLSAFSRSMQVINQEAWSGHPAELLPIGLHGPDGSVNERPQAIAEITAAILSVALIKNKLTNQQFYVMEVAIYSLKLTVVADPALLKDGTPSPGDWIRGEFWLSGRLKNCVSSRPKESRWKRLSSIFSK